MTYSLKQAWMVQSKMRQACKHVHLANQTAKKKKEKLNLTNSQSQKGRGPHEVVFKNLTFQGRKNLARFWFVLIEGTRKSQKLHLQGTGDLITDLNKVGKLNIH